MHTIYITNEVRIDTYSTRNHLMSLWYFCLFMAQLIQLGSYFLILHQITSKKSVAGLSCDFTLLSWLSSISASGSGLAYQYLERIRSQYSIRYPVYKDIHTSIAISMIDLVSLIVTSMMLFHQFVTYRKSIIGDDWISLPIKVLVLGQAAFFLWFVSLFTRGRATINELDLTDCAWTIGTICFGIRLISQVSNNFWIRYFRPHRKFLLYQSISMALAIGGWVISRHMNIRWHQMPANVMSQFVLGPNVICLLVLSIQAYRSGKLRMYLPIGGH